MDNHDYIHWPYNERIRDEEHSSTISTHEFLKQLWLKQDFERVGTTDLIFCILSSTSRAAIKSHFKLEVVPEVCVLSNFDIKDWQFEVIVDKNSVEKPSFKLYKVTSYWEKRILEIIKVNGDRSSTNTKERSLYVWKYPATTTLWNLYFLPGKED